ncbi:head maturation protease, ClpP-related [Paenibacillus dendritiformis]|uniref:head maturation protease, ClpP-related n=1 Tax=Paenibacillus dendritiformis TaxID=130049 RepID=UPI000DA6F909|nr:head maturation protease, ClpP-related [Paenibacillus dendritiformis]PZM62610.1 Clp protease ClpP [Paenibacillus dendritiformis]
MAKVNIKGVIVSNDVYEIYEWFGIEAVCPNNVMEQIESANGEPLEVDINSGGGDVYAGSEIYTALKEYKGDVTTRIVGLAASAASVAAMAGKKVVISPTAQMMIHNVSSWSHGDYRDHRHESEVTKNYNKSIANAYVLKSGMTQDEVLALMDEETWFTAQQALEKGLVDEIMFEDSGSPMLVASAYNTPMLPPSVIDKIRNELIKDRQSKIKQTQENGRVAKVPLSLLQKKLLLQGRMMNR